MNIYKSKYKGFEIDAHLEKVPKIEERLSSNEQNIQVLQKNKADKKSVPQTIKDIAPNASLVWTGISTPSDGYDVWLYPVAQDGVVYIRLKNESNEWYNYEVIMASQILNAIEPRLEEIESIAKGSTSGYVFDTYDAMLAALDNPDFVEHLVLGNNLYIRALDVPDYWWDGAQAQPLETQKVVLGEYVKKTDIDSEMSDTSTNPVQNKAAKKYVDKATEDLSKKALSVTKITDLFKLEYGLSEGVYQLIRGAKIVKKVAKMSGTFPPTSTLEWEEVEYTPVSDVIAIVGKTEIDENEQILIPVTFVGNIKSKENDGSCESVLMCYIRGDYPGSVAIEPIYDVSFENIGGGGGVTVADGKVYVKDGSRNIELVQAYQTYGVSIDLSNSNPETAVTYTDDAVGMVAGSPDWYKMSIFNKIKPCLFKNGAVVGYLNPDNFAQYVDGTAADISSGDSGDVMIEIPKTGYKISKSGTTLTVQITDDSNKKGFSYKAHTRAEDGDREKLYIGAFLGSNKGGKLRSVSGVSPLNATGLTDFRTYAKANGAGYDLFAFYPMTLLQCLYLIMYKNLDSETALGMGYVGDSDWEYMQKNTGATVDKGMSYGSTDSMQQMKFLGIEDFWGNLYQWIDGLVSSSTRNALVATDNFNDTGDGYTDIGRMCASNMYGYMKEPQGNNDAGFIISATGGSASTYFSNYAHFCGGCVPAFGGSFGGGANAGAFRLSVNCRPDWSDDYFGGRLMFL